MGARAVVLGIGERGSVNGPGGNILGAPEITYRRLWAYSSVLRGFRDLITLSKAQGRSLKRLKISVLEFQDSSFSASKNIIFSNIRLQEGLPGESMRTKGGGGERRRPDIRMFSSLG